MPPVLHLVRHGQGFHSSSVTKDGHLLRDPQLTDKGKEQCRRRCEAFHGHDKIELLLASPLRRALQTCQLAFAPCLARGLAIVALPHAEEVSDAPADTGSPVADLRREFPAVDFDLLGDRPWYEHVGEFASDPAAVNERARRLRHWIRARPEREVALVSHGFFNHFLTGDVNDRGEQTTPWWEEAELRTYTFGEGEAGDDGQAMIYETKGSLIARGGMLEGGGNQFIKLNEPARRGKTSEN